MRNLNTFFFILSFIAFLLSAGSGPLLYFAIGFTMAWVLYWLGTIWPSLFFRKTAAPSLEQIENDLVTVANRLRTKYDSPVWLTGEGELLPLCLASNTHLVNLEQFLVKVVYTGSYLKSSSVLFNQVETTDPLQWLELVRGEMARRGMTSSVNNLRA